MHSGSITIGFLLLILMSGCSSASKIELPTKDNAAVKDIASCDSSKRDANQNYTWSLPEHAGFRNSSASTWQIVQVRGEPNHFILCDECPCPTHKNQAQRTTVNLPPPTRKWTIHFDNGVYSLSDEHKQVLIRLYQELPEDYRITITGYTDDSAPGGTITNQSLAKLRAESVLNFLTQLGVASDAVTLQAKPLCCYIAPNSNESGRALNRRTEIVLSALSTRGIQP